MFSWPILFVTAAGMAIAQLLSPWARDAFGEWPAAVLVLALAILVHELGHLATAVAAGLEPWTLVAGPIRIVWRAGRARLHANFGLLPVGFVSAFAAKGSPSRAQMIWVVVGGPAANILFALLIGIVSLAIPYRPRPESIARLLQQVAYAAAGVSLLLGVVNLMSLQSLEGVSDGRRLRDLLREEPDAERWRAILTLLGGSALRGERPRDWSSGLLRVATLLEDGEHDENAACLLAFYAALDRRDFAGAREWVARGRRVTAGTAWKHAWAMLEAFHDAGVRGDAASARALLHGVPQLLRSRSHIGLLAEAATLVVEGRGAEAHDAISRARRALDEVEEAPGIDLMQREWLDKLASAAATASRTA